MARIDLMDRLDAVLPRVNPTDEAREILSVMARICRAASAAVFFEQGGALRWLAGDLLPDDVATAIRSAWQSQRGRVLTGTEFTEPGVADTPEPSRLTWIRRPADGGLDVVYFAGPNLRPLDACSVRLIRLAALLGRLPGRGKDDYDE